VFLIDAYNTGLKIRLVIYLVKLIPEAVRKVLLP